MIGPAAPERQIERWLASPSEFTGDLATDTVLLAERVSDAERLWVGRPGAVEEDRESRVPASAVLDSCCDLRAAFMARHAEEVYDELTAHRREQPRLSELVGLAAERYPGLVPTREHIVEQALLPQADKDGSEIDQGVFFRGLLRSPSAGTHLVEAMLRPSRRAQQLLPLFRRTGRLKVGAVLLERRGAAAHVTVANTYCLNAEDNELIDDMELAVDLVLLDDQVRVGVLRGGVMDHPRYSGRRVFSAGINLRHLHEGRISYVDFLLGRELGYISKMLRGAFIGPDPAPGTVRETVQKPWIAAVDTFAIGGGMQLLLVCDVVIAADDSWFSLPAAQEGIVPGAANLRLGRAVGARLARQILLSGRRIRAVEPEAAALCDETPPPGEVDAAVEAAVLRMDNPAVVANKRALLLAEEPVDAFRAYMAEFAYAQAVRMNSPDVIHNVGRAWSRHRGGE